LEREFLACGHSASQSLGNETRESGNDSGLRPLLYIIRVDKASSKVKNQSLPEYQSIHSDTSKLQLQAQIEDLALQEIEMLRKHCCARSNRKSEND
jgi:hypothetical protein